MTTGPTGAMARRASRIVCAEDFIKDIEDGGEDGYFVSSKWLLSLEEYETESLMSVLRRAGYSGTYQTPTTTLFARIQRDLQYGIMDNDAPGTFTNTDVRPGDSEGVRSPKYGHDLSLEIAAGETLKNIDLKADITDMSKSERLSVQSASSPASSKDYPDLVLAIPSEAENTPGNVLQQSENPPHNQYEAPIFIWTETLLQHFVNACDLCGGASNANAQEISELMSKGGFELPLDAVESCLLAYESVLGWIDSCIEQLVYKTGTMVGTKESRKKKNLATMEHAGRSSAGMATSKMELSCDIMSILGQKARPRLREENEQVLQRHQLRIQQLREEQQQVEELLEEHERRLRQAREFLQEGQTQVIQQLGDQLYHQAMGKHLQAKQQLIQQELQLEKRRGERPQDQQVKDVTEDQNEDDSAVLVSKTRSPELQEHFPSDFTESSIGNAANACFGDEVGEKISRASSRVIGEERGASSKSFEPPPQIIEEDVGDHQGPTGKSFKAALQSKIPQSFCVSTQSLSNFKDLEEEALKAGYEKVCQTGTTTWYQKSRDHHVKNLAGGAYDDGSYRLSNRTDVPDGSVNEPRTSESGYRNVLGQSLGQSGPSQSVDNTDRCHDVDDEHKTSSFGVASELKKTRAQHGDSICHPQLLRVTCSSPSQTPRDLSPNGLYNRQKFGDSVVTMPGSQGQNISTTIEKPFSVMKIDFSGDGRGREVPIDLKAIVTTSLSCCLKDGHDSSKVRIKLSRISGDVKTEESYQESCNAMVLSSSYTSVFGCIRSNREGDFEQINLNLEDEYRDPPSRRVLATTSVDLVWLEISGRTPNNCEPGSVTLALKGDIIERRKEDALRQIQGVHPLLFQEPRPVIVGGDVNVPLRPDIFLEFHIRSQLDVSYFKPWTPISEEGPVWPANDTTKVIDFGCCLEIRAEDLRLHSQKKRKR